MGMPIVTAPALPVTEGQRVELKRMAGSSSLPHRTVMQAKALLWAADGVANQEIARRCGVDSDAVRRWRAKFTDKGVDGVGVIAKGRGRKPVLPDGTVAEIVRVTCQEKPGDTSTHWSTRSLAKRFGVGKDTIAKVWADHNLKPWKVDTRMSRIPWNFGGGPVEHQATFTSSSWQVSLTGCATSRSSAARRTGRCR